MPKITAIRISLLLAMVFAGVRFNGCAYLQLADLRTIDFRFRQRGEQPASPAVVIVTVDGESLNRIGRWPWPRSVQAELIDRITEAEPAVIGFDIVQSESSDKTALSQLPPPPAGVDTDTWEQARQTFAEMTGGEKELAAAIKRSDRAVVGYFFDSIRREGEGFSTEEIEPAPINTYNLVLGSPGKDGNREIPSASKVVGNLPAIHAAARSNGYFNSWPDRDGTYRRMPLVFRYGDQKALPLSLAMLKQKYGAAATSIRIEPHGVDEIKFGPTVIPINEAGELLLNYRGPGKSFLHISAADMLEGTVDPELLRGKFVIVGVTAVAVADIKSAPFAPSYPGVEMHATVLDNILTRDFLRLPEYFVLLEIAVLIFAVVFVGIALRLMRGIGGATATIGLAVAYVFGSQWIFEHQGIPLGLAFPIAAMALSYSAISLFHYLTEEREKQQIRAAFGTYLSPDMVDAVSSDPSKLKLGGEKKNLSILFSDIRGFTTISEALTPEDLTRLINRFLTPMTNTILERKGTIDKYIGDCIMAFWNAPLDDERHVQHACDAAVQLNRLLLPLNDTLEKEAAEEGRPHHPLRAGIGINTGDCVVGNVGSEVRFDYSLLGDAVNLAARLESITKQYGVAIIISEFTRAAAPEFATLEADLVKVKGKTEPVRIFTLLGEPELAASPEFRRLEEAHIHMLDAYRKQSWDQADAWIAKCRDLYFEGMTVDPDSALRVFYDVYAERVATYRADPPGEDWDGVFTATSK